MIERHRASNVCCTEFIRKLGCLEASYRLYTCKVRPKPYDELVRIFGKDADDRINTPWGTIATMEDIFITRPEVFIHIDSMDILGISIDGTSHYLMQCNGWSYPSGAFEVIDKDFKGTISNIKGLNL